MTNAQYVTRAAQLKGLSLIKPTKGNPGIEGGRMTTANVRNMPASQAYGVRAEELLALVKGLEADVTDSLVDAHDAHWGHIGDLGRALELAQQLRDLLRGEVK